MSEQSRKVGYTEPEYCDDCGEVVGYYDSSLPEGEKIVVTRNCECVRRRWGTR